MAAYVVTSGNDGLVCDWESAEEAGDGLWLVRCHRTDDNAGLCWYLVTYRCSGGFREGGVCVKVHEEFLGCEGGEEQCTQDQRDIDAEYDNPALYNPTRRPHTDFSCEDFEHPDITHGTGTHDHDKGFISFEFWSNRGWVLNCCPGIDLQITSDWRCPQGNADVGGVIGSWHMEGNGGDFAKTNGTALTYDEWDKIQEFAREELNATGISAWGDPCKDCFRYKRWIHVDWR